ncbi:signal peptidase I [Microbacterium sp. ANT_H45B]|uniref:signal peptidase I n=1 Tax=Microbacterium sp. ANT_H45B TaxID=2597346 RepID=UPI0011EF6727|nr:signal peptidase I [Microbacterium sp. ANT_H45B]KAA0962775.1 signal peptidase I [Microbacterium sp. ANT_H45B]
MSAPATRRGLREQGAERFAVPDAAGSEARRRGAMSRAGRLVVDVLLWAAAIAGTICMVLVVLALTAQITLIMFRTGSMSPTIPAGSVAVVQQVPASEIAVGDVVTVDRPGDLPVTHRVTSVAPGESGEQRVLTMRGDANAADDPYSYTVESVRVVLFSVPGIATVIVALGDPVVLGGLTIAATALVVWAFWPRRARGATGVDS